MTSHNRQQRKGIAQETIDILEQETYTISKKTVSIASPLAAMRKGTTLYTPADLDTLIAQQQPAGQHQTEIDVVNTTTFKAARTLIAEGYTNPLCLNFASAKNPGGGFLGGSQAQEEYLARNSALYASLQLKPEYYEANRHHRSTLYTNHLIYSPSVPVFRAENSSLLPNPYTVSIITSPAVNAGAVHQNEPQNAEQIPAVMATRIRAVLSVARHQQHDTLVLGAWGCGVFRNKPQHIAQWFADALLEDDRFKSAFRRITFAVLDFRENTPTFTPFVNQFTI